jgi:hypothetical protein
MPVPLSHSTVVHGGGCHYNNDLSDAQENLMKMLHHLTMACGVVVAPCPVAVLPGCHSWSSIGNKWHVKKNSICNIRNGVTHMDQMDKFSSLLTSSSDFGVVGSGTVWLNFWTL